MLALAERSQRRGLYPVMAEDKGGTHHATTTYIIRFAHRYRPTSVPYEEQEHTNLADAWEAYWLLTEPTSAEMYSQIEGGLCPTSG